MTSLNGEIAIDVFKNDLSEDYDFYILFGGLNQLTKNMYQEYKSNGGKFKPYFKLVSFDYNNDIFTCMFQNKEKQVLVNSKHLIFRYWWRIYSTYQN